MLRCSRLYVVRSAGNIVSQIDASVTSTLQHADMLGVGAQLDIAAPDIATIRAIYRRRRATLFEHQTWAIAYLGMCRFQPGDQIALRMTGERQIDSETVLHLTPLGFEHINFDGVLSFTLDRHRARIRPSSLPPVTLDLAAG